MTERGQGSVRRTGDSLAIGPSAFAWDGTSLTIEIDERGAPLPSCLRGRVKVHPLAVTDHVMTLDRDGRHAWWPIAPAGRIEVELTSPALRWTGSAYFDTNAGVEPLENAFSTWNWSRLPLENGVAVLYHANWRQGGGSNITIRCDRSGEVVSIADPPVAALPPTRLWRMPRETRALPGDARILTTLEDAPFYSRSVLTSRFLGERVTGIHESLSMERFINPFVQLMLPFRMPRRPS